jgi:hypothetical protein
LESTGGGSSGGWGDDEVDRLVVDLVASEAEASAAEAQDEGGSFLLLHIFL